MPDEFVEDILDQEAASTSESEQHAAAKSEALEELGEALEESQNQALNREQRKEFASFGKWYVIIYSFLAFATVLLYGLFPAVLKLPENAVVALVSSGPIITVSLVLVILRGLFRA